VDESDRLVLRERAHRLAQPPPEPDMSEQEMLLFRLGDELYAVELGVLRSVQPSHGVTRVPGVPAHVAGVLNVRGQVISVLNLSAFLGLSGPVQSGKLAQLLLVDLPGRQVALLVDEVVEIRPLPRDALGSPPPGSRYALGVAEGRILVLDLVRLLAEPGLEIAEEVTDLSVTHSGLTPD
jgi:purine-binding chemotaxis protein CheW